MAAAERRRKEVGTKALSERKRPTAVRS